MSEKLPKIACCSLTAAVLEALAVYLSEAFFGLPIGVEGLFLSMSQQALIVYEFPLPVALSVVSTVLLTESRRDGSLSYALLMAVVVAGVFNANQFYTFFSAQTSFYGYVLSDISIVNTGCALLMSASYAVAYRVSNDFIYRFLVDNLKAR